YPATDFGAGQMLLDELDSFDEIDGVRVVLFDARGDGEDVWIEDDVFGIELEFLDQQFVGALADLELALARVSLALFIEGHDHGRRAVLLTQSSLGEEVLLSFFEADRVDDGLTLH